MAVTEGSGSDSEGTLADIVPSVSDQPDYGSADPNGEEGQSDRTMSLRRAAPFLILIYVLISGIVWSAVTPPGGVPDEPAHLVYAAGVVRNDYGEPVSVDPSTFSMLMSHTVPAWIPSIVVCYAFAPAVTADCQPPIIESSDPVEALTTVSRYPPVYYWIVGLPSLGLDGERALYAMRVASAILATLLIGLGLLVAAPGRRWWLSIGVLIAFTPMTAFLIGSVNPNGAEIAAAIGLGVALLGLTGEASTARRIWVQAVAIAVLGGYLAWARPNTWLILGAVVGATFLLNRRSVVSWVRAKPLAAIVTGSAVGVAVLATIPYEALVRNPVESALATGQIPSSASLVENLDSTLGHWATWMMDTVGILGWLDHAVPQPLRFLSLTILGALLVIALAIGRRMDRLLLLAVLIGSTFVGPFFVLEFSFGSVVGYQARYHLSLVVLMALASMFILGLRWVDDFRLIVRPILGWIGILSPLVMVGSVLWSFSRYAVGQPLVWSNIFLLRFLSDAAWQPPPKAVAVAILGLGGLVVLAPFLRHVGRDVVTVHFENEIDDGE